MGGFRQPDRAHRVPGRWRAHHPVYAHAHRMPPRHFGSWVWAVFMLVVMTAVMVPLLPQEVNGAAYLVGAENQVTFTPVEYVQICGKGGCHTGTDGYLSGSGANVRWDSQVPLDKTFPVRVPLWNWRTGHNLVGSTGGAIALLVVGLFFNAFALLLLFALITAIRARRLILHPDRQVPTGSLPGGGTPRKWSPEMSQHRKWHTMPPVGSDIGTSRPDNSDS
jgi:hypothetical protein